MNLFIITNYLSSCADMDTLHTYTNILQTFDTTLQNTSSNLLYSSTYDEKCKLLIRYLKQTLVRQIFSKNIKLSKSNVKNISQQINQFLSLFDYYLRAILSAKTELVKSEYLSKHTKLLAILSSRFIQHQQAIELSDYIVEYFGINSYQFLLNAIKQISAQQIQDNQSIFFTDATFFVNIMMITQSQQFLENYITTNYGRGSIDTMQIIFDVEKMLLSSYDKLNTMTFSKLIEEYLQLIGISEFKKSDQVNLLKNIEILLQNLKNIDLSCNLSTWYTILLSTMHCIIKNIFNNIFNNKYNLCKREFVYKFIQRTTHGCIFKKMPQKYQQQEFNETCNTLNQQFLEFSKQIEN